MDFDAAADRQIAGEKVRCARMVEFQWKSGTALYWPGEWPLTTLDGRTWRPTLGQGAITGIRQSTNGTAPEMKFELSGIDAAFVRKAQAESAEYYGRLVRIFLQFFDAGWQPLGTPMVLTWGLMRSIVSRRESMETGLLRTIILTAESPFDGRARARNSYLTDTDQKARHPGDRMCERIAGIEAKLLVFPDY